MNLDILGDDVTADGRQPLKPMTSDDDVGACSRERSCVL